MPAIISDAKLFGNAREKVELEAAAAVKTAEAAALTAQASAIQVTPPIPPATPI